MASGESVSVWIDDMRRGDDDAAHKIWSHFAHRLQNAIRPKINPTIRRVYDEEDAAQSAFNSLCKGLSAGRFPDLHDGESLWRLLLVITCRKISIRTRNEQRDIRDVRRNTDAATVLAADASGSVLDPLSQFPSQDLPPEFEAEFAETCASLFEEITEPMMAETARLRIEGNSVPEIAEKLNVSTRTVHRKLELVRRCWERVDAETSQSIPPT